MSIDTAQRIGDAAFYAILASAIASVCVCLVLARIATLDEHPAPLAPRPLRELFLWSVAIVAGSAFAAVLVLAYAAGGGQ